MPQKTNASWPWLAMQYWMLAGEAATVMWLRSLRLMAGGPGARREAERMVSEKFAANMALLPEILRAPLPASPEELSARTLAHYRRKVRANRQRLGGGSGRAGL